MAMGTMTLTINLPEDVGTALRTNARTSGKDLAEYVESMITAQIKRPPLRQYFADVRESISVDDDELQDIIDDAIAESRDNRRD